MTCTRWLGHGHPANAWHIVYRGDRGLVDLDLNWGRRGCDGGRLARAGHLPDGPKIAVTYKQHVQWEVHVMNVDGGGEARLTETSL